MREREREREREGERETGCGGGKGGGERERGDYHSDGLGKLDNSELLGKDHFCLLIVS